MQGIKKVFACVFAALFPGLFSMCFAEPAEPASSVPAPNASERLFLDRLMAAESGGRLDAKSGASSASGPFQFLSATFLEVVRRNFPALSAGKSSAEILELRADAKVARNAALVYTRENARFLAARGTPVTGAALRLAFFVGPSGAMKVLAAKPGEPLSNILNEATLQANPVLRQMTAAALIARSSREANGLSLLLAAPLMRVRSKVDVRCNLKLASCRKWLALAETRMGLRRVILAPASTD